MSLTLISGPMFAGKTQLLLNRLATADAAGAAVVAAKPLVDSRFGTSTIVSHTGESRPATVISSAGELLATAADRDVVGIDEGQFLDLGTAWASCTLASTCDVVVAALDLDFRTRPFPATALLQDRADEVVRLAATCGRCGDAATLTQRLINGNPAPPTDPVIRIGAAELYEPRCSRCFGEHGVSIRRVS
jgi:thymidine kinase